MRENIFDYFNQIFLLTIIINYIFALAKRGVYDS